MDVAEKMDEEPEGDVTAGSFETTGSVLEADMALPDMCRHSTLEDLSR